jgi:hypothetical protein
MTGSGTLSSAGLYAAPTVAPASPGVAVTYTAGSATASAQLQVATAFVGTPASVPIDAGTESPINVPFEHQFAANGANVYTALTAALTAGGPRLEADIFASSDDGKTFTGPTVYHTGDLGCATLAVDPGDPSVVYLAYLAGHGDSTGNTGGTLRLAVSTDGAKTFPVEYDAADSVNTFPGFICPDVTAPSADHVIISGVTQDENLHGRVATFASGSRGANIGPVSQEGVAGSPNPDGGDLAGSDTNGGAPTDCPVYADSGNAGPRLFTNGNGSACVVFQYGTGGAGCTDGNNIAVQCSQDSGATWTSPVLLGPLTKDAVPTGAMSPSGKIAVTWVDAAGTQSQVAFSTDGGKTFGTPAQYPAGTPAANGGTSTPVLAWENDTVLWLAQTANLSNTPALYVDKTCDDGATWSGLVKVGVYRGSSLFLTSAGMVAGGDTASNTSGGGAVATIPLFAQ